MSQDSQRFLIIYRELLEGVPGQFGRRFQFIDNQNETDDKRLTTQEHDGTLIREQATVRLFRNGKLNINAYIRPDILPSFLWSCLHAPSTLTLGSSTNPTFTPAHSKQYIEILAAPDGGTFTVTVMGYTTAPVAFNISTANLQAVLRNLPSVRGANVTVTGTAGTEYIIDFSTASGLLRGVNVPPIGVDGSLLTVGAVAGIASAVAGPNAQTVVIGGSPTGGSFTLQIPTIGIATITYAVGLTAATIQAALQALPGMSGNVFVAGAATGGTGGTFTVLIKGSEITRMFAMIGVSSMTGGTPTLAVSVVGALGAGMFDHTQKGGASSKPTITIIEYDGVDLTVYSGVSINNWTLEQPLTDAYKISMEGVGKGEVHMPYDPVALPTWSTTVANALTATGDQVVTPGSVANILEIGQPMIAVNADGFTNYEQVTVKTMSDPTWLITIGGGATGGTFTLDYDGPGAVSSAITYSGALTAATVQTALQAVADLYGCTVTVTGSAGGPFTVVLKANPGFDRFNSTLVGTSSLTGGTPTLAVTNATTVTCTFANTHNVSSWILRSIPIPDIVLFGTGFNLDPTQEILTVNGVTPATLKTWKISGKNNRDPEWVQGTPSTDPVRITEGPVSVDGDFTLRYTALAGSFYQNFRNNTDPGPIVIKHTESAYQVQGLSPFVELTMPEVRFEKGQRMKMVPETQQNVKPKLLKDPVSGTQVQIKTRNEICPLWLAAT